MIDVAGLGAAITLRRVDGGTRWITVSAPDGGAGRVTTSKGWVDHANTNLPEGRWTTSAPVRGDLPSDALDSVHRGVQELLDTDPAGATARPGQELIVHWRQGGQSRIHVITGPITGTAEFTKLTGLFERLARGAER